MQNNKIDILLLQEWSLLRHVFNTNDKSYHDSNGDPHSLSFPIAFFKGYKVHHVGTETAILYRRSLDVTPLPAQPSYDKANRTQNCHISSIILHHNNEDISIHSVYKCPRGDATQLFGYQTFTDHSIFAGDFNIKHPHWGSDASSTESNNFYNLYENTNWRILNATNPSYTHIHSSDPNKMSNIDLSMISNDIKCNFWNILHAYYNPFLSDHIPIKFQIKFEDKIGYDESRITWNLKSKQWPKFQIYLSNLIKNTQFDPHPDIHAQEISRLITLAANKTIGSHRFYHGYKPWWNSNINRLKKDAKRLQRKLHRMRKNAKRLKRDFHSFPKYRAVKTDLKITRALQWEAIDKAKQQYNNRMNSYVQSTINFNKKFWRLISNDNDITHHNIPPLIYKNKTNIIDPHEQARALHDAMTNPPDPPCLPHHKQFHQNVNAFVYHKFHPDLHYDYDPSIIPNTPVDQYESIENDNDIESESNDDPKQINYSLIDDLKDPLNNTIYFYEIRNVIANLDTVKAMGPDKIHNLMIIKGGIDLWRHLVILFNKCLVSGIFPKCWNFANILPIPKPNRDHSDPKNFRPIAISSTLGRVFE
eukprot:101419_1